ncbi:MAG: hypothetical protein ACE363_12545 [Alphaproteobacteria bacterium]
MSDTRRLFHLHADFMDGEHIVEETGLVDNAKLQLTVQNFHFPSPHCARSLLCHVPGGSDPTNISLLTSEECNGAPQTHLSAPRFNGSLVSAQYQDYLNSHYHPLVEAIEKTGLSAYVEFEDVSFREVLISPHEIVNEAWEPFPIEAVDKVSLGIQGMPRFRSTEIHVSFEDWALVNTNIMTSMLKAGFNSAYIKDQRTEKLKFIATIQGEEAEISSMLHITRRWLVDNIKSGSIVTNVTVKKEDIVAYEIFGDNNRLPEIIRPGATL